MTTYLIFDTETTGFTLDNQPPEHPKQPFLLQLGVVVADGKEAKETRLEWEVILNHTNLMEVPAAAAKVHGINVKQLRDKGKSPLDVLKRFDTLVREVDVVCAYNMSFDEVVALAAYHRVGGTGSAFKSAKKICLMQSATEPCAIPKAGTSRGHDRYKYPSLAQAYKLLVDKAGFADAHTALADAEAAHQVLRALLTMDIELIYEPPPELVPGAKAPSLEQVSEELLELDTILSLAQDNPHQLTEWEEVFIDDFTEKRERYGETTRVSPKQLDVLRRIKAKLEEENSTARWDGPK